MALNRWLLLAAVGLVAVTARLGLWQLDRADQKERLHSARFEQASMPALSAQRLPGTASEAAAQQHRRADVQGRWLGELSIYLENRVMNGRTGFYLVTPMLLDDGSAVLVQRGWLPRDIQDRTRRAEPPAQAGQVTAHGRIAGALSRLFEFDAAASGPIRQNLDLDAYARESGLRLRPWVLIQEDGPATPTDGLLRQWPSANLGLHKHHGYAFQWFSLSALTIVLYVWFQFIRPWRGRARPAAS